MRVIRLIFAVALTAVAFAGCTTWRPDARGTVRDFTFPYIFDYAVENRESFRWSDAYLDADPTVYHQELAGPLSALAASVYGYRASMDCDSLASLGFDPMDTCRRYGADIDYADPVWGRDQVGYTFAYRRGFLMLIIRGTYGRDEWVSNLNVCNTWGHAGTFEAEKLPALHEGFSRAADFVYRNLTNYIAKKAIDLNRVKICLTGHSRGAAVANILGARLDDELGAARTNLFVYTFATPNTILDARRDGRAPRYRNIFNVLNPEDMVPLAPLVIWRSMRFGQDLRLRHYDALGFTGSFTDGPYCTMKAAFEKMTGEPYWHTPFGTTSTEIMPATIGALAPTLKDLYEMPDVQRKAGNFTSVHAVLESMVFRKMKPADSEDADISLGADIEKVSRLGTYAEEGFLMQFMRKRFILPSGLGGDSEHPGWLDIPWRLACMHATQTYIGWMKAGEKYGPDAIYLNFEHGASRSDDAAEVSCDQARTERR